MLTSSTASPKVLQDAKAKSGMTYEQLAQKIGKSEVFVAGIFFGQMKPSVDDLKGLLLSLLSLNRCLLLLFFAFQDLLQL